MKSKNKHNIDKMGSKPVLIPKYNISNSPKYKKVDR